MNKEELVEFLFKARTNTNAKAGSQVRPSIEGTEQSEYSEGDWLYRDVYFNGKGTFMGVDSVYLKGKVVWASSYYGRYKGITEKELDKILRKAMKDNPETCGWRNIEANYGDFKYTCSPDWEGANIENMAGVERIFKGEQEIYTFYYGGSLLV